MKIYMLKNKETGRLYNCGFNYPYWEDNFAKVMKQNLVEIVEVKV